METPLVSICSITYNHAPFIRQCLDGFLMQQCNFPIEIIINDDCSTDGTTEIIREYAEKYPDKIFPIFHEENLYSQGVRGMAQKFVYPKARGKYIALCEGDDYWTDPLKLQKQVDFLESHPDYSMCFHKAVVVGNGDVKQIYSQLIEGEYTSVKILSLEQHIPTASIVVLKKVVDLIPFHKDFCVGDVLIHATAFEYGRVFCLGDTMSIYRKHPGGWTSSVAQELRLRANIKHYKAMRDFYTEGVRKGINCILGKNYAWLFRFLIHNRKYANALMTFFKAMRYSKKYFCFSLKNATNSKFLKGVLEIIS